jgi:hypothetical protein
LRAERSALRFKIKKKYKKKEKEKERSAKRKKLVLPNKEISLLLFPFLKMLLIYSKTFYWNRCYLSDGFINIILFLLVGGNALHMIMDEEDDPSNLALSVTRFFPNINFDKNIRDTTKEDYENIIINLTNQINGLNNNMSEPEKENIYLERGSIYFVIGCKYKVPELHKYALSDIDKVIKINNNNAEYWIFLATIHYYMDNCLEARELYIRYLDHNGFATMTSGQGPNHNNRNIPGKFYIELALICDCIVNDQEKKIESIKWMEMAVNRNPKFEFDIYYLSYFGYIQIRLHNFIEANDLLLKINNNILLEYQKKGIKHIQMSEERFLLTKNNFIIAFLYTIQNNFQLAEQYLIIFRDLFNGTESHNNFLFNFFEELIKFAVNSSTFKNTKNKILILESEMINQCNETHNYNLEFLLIEQFIVGQRWDLIEIYLEGNILENDDPYYHFLLTILYLSKQKCKSKPPRHFIAGESKSNSYEDKFKYVFKSIDSFGKGLLNILKKNKKTNWELSIKSRWILHILEIIKIDVITTGRFDFQKIINDENEFVKDISPKDFLMSPKAMLHDLHEFFMGGTDSSLLSLESPLKNAFICKAELQNNSEDRTKSERESKLFESPLAVRAIAEGDSDSCGASRHIQKAILIHNLKALLKNNSFFNLDLANNNNFFLKSIEARSAHKNPIMELLKNIQDNPDDVIFSYYFMFIIITSNNTNVLESVHIEANHFLTNISESFLADIINHIWLFYMEHYHCMYSTKLSLYHHSESSKITSSGIYTVLAKRRTVLLLLVVLMNFLIMIFTIEYCRKLIMIGI